MEQTKEDKKALKLQEKNLKKFYKLAKIKKKDSLEEIKLKILNYVNASTNLDELEKMQLPSELADDNEFLINLYKANFETTNIYPPKDELKQDIDFMVNYVNVVHNHDNAVSQWGEQTLAPTLAKFKEYLHNSEFVNKLMERFPTEDFPHILQNLLFDSSNKENVLHEYERVMREISEENLCNMVKTFGWHTLGNIPKDIPFFAKLVEVGTQVDGFESLKLLALDQVKEHKELVLKTAKICNGEGLSNYIYNVLDSNRSKSEIIDGKMQTTNYHDDDIEALQKELLEDEDIIYYLKREKENRNDLYNSMVNDQVEDKILKPRGLY